MSWAYKEFDSICDFQSGLWTGKKQPFQTAKVIRNTNFTKDCRLDLSDVVELSVETNQFLKRELQYGDLILEKSGGGPKQAVGRVVKFDIEDKGYSVSNFTSIIRIKNNAIIDFNFLQKYLYYFYVSGQTLPLQNNSTGIRNLNNKAYQKISIPVPPLSEQQNIVEKLDAAFELIDRAKANIEQNIQNAKELFQSKLNDVFESGKLKVEDGAWEKTFLPYISLNLDAKRIPITKNKRQSGIYPYYGASGIVDFVDDFIFEGEYLLVSEDGANLLARTYPIAFTANGKFWVNNHAHILKFENHDTHKFVEYYLNAISLEDYVSGMAQPKLNQAMLNKIPIYKPTSLETQQKIVDQLDQLSAQTELLQQKYQQKLQNLGELRKSILEKAFKGEIV